MQQAMAVYVKSLSKRAEGADKEKQLPGGHLGSSMVTHGEDFEPDSEFGICLSCTFAGQLQPCNPYMVLTTASPRPRKRASSKSAGDICSKRYFIMARGPRALPRPDEGVPGGQRTRNQSIAFIPTNYYCQATRKKLETRRLAYDTSLAKMQKTKKEDFRMEEELRSQKAKYEETSEEVFRRMQDIKESEVDMVQDLTAFLEAELSYYDRCREILLTVKREWPVR